MASRMERYKDKVVRPSRSTRNKNLYNSIYSYDDKYSNIEGVASIDKYNEIDISKVKKMLETREKANSEKRINDSSDYYQDSQPFRTHYKEDTDRNYDIMDVLKTAKEKREPDNKDRVLNNTGYDILKTLNLKPKNDDNDDKEELKDLIETISHTSMLNKRNDDSSKGEESNDLDMFSDMLSDDTMVRDVKDFTEFASLGEKTMDDSFFTGGLNIKKADFVNGGKKQGSFIKTFLIVMFVMSFLAGAIFLILKYFNII